jgi:hypothetical protein
MNLAKRLDGFEGYLGTAMALILTRMKAEGKDVINLLAMDRLGRIV